MVHSKDDRGLGWRLLEGAGSCLCYAGHTHFSLSFLSIAKSNPSSIHAWGGRFAYGKWKKPSTHSFCVLNMSWSKTTETRVELGSEKWSLPGLPHGHSCAGTGDGWPPPGFSIATNRTITKDSWVPKPLGSHPSNDSHQFCRITWLGCLWISLKTKNLIILGSYPLTKDFSRKVNIIFKGIWLEEEVTVTHTNTMSPLLE